MPRIISYDGREITTSDSVRPDRYRQLYAELAATDPISTSTGVIPRGAGLSYAAASHANGSKSVITTCFNRLIDFEPESNSITVEPGITLGDLLKFIVPHGFYLGVLPGHPSITIGGCIGCNVHGKSQFHSGNFIECVDSLTLFHPDHGSIDCSRSQNPELFKLTIGGFGLTGFIVSAKLRLQKLSGQTIEVKRTPVANLVAAVTEMERLKSTFEVFYSWNNLNRRGNNFGSGYVYAERFSEVVLPELSEFNQLTPPQKKFDRLGLLNRLTTPIMCSVYSAVEALSSDTKRQGIYQGSFPINGKEIYYRLFGRLGFQEYQCILPRELWADFVRALENIIAKLKAPISLGSLKLFQGDKSLLNFSATGVCIAIDTPVGPTTVALFKELDAIMIAMGGTVNIAKDSRLEAKIVEQLFPERELFKTKLLEFDPKRRFNSALRERLCV